VNEMKTMDYLVIGGVGYLIFMMFKKSVESEPANNGGTALGWGEWIILESSRNDTNTHTYELQEAHHTTKRIGRTGFNTRTYYRIVKDGVPNAQSRTPYYNSALAQYRSLLGKGSITQGNLDVATSAGQLGTALSGNAMNRAVTPSSNNINRNDGSLNYANLNNSRSLGWR